MNNISEIKLKRKLISLIKKGSYNEALIILNNICKENILSKDNPWAEEIYKLENGL